MSAPLDPPGLLDRLQAASRPPGSPPYTRAQILTSAIWALSIGGWLLTRWLNIMGEVRIDGLLSVQLECLLFALVVLVLWRGPLQPPLLIRRPRKPGWS